MNEVNNHDEFWGIVIDYKLEKAIMALKDAGFKLDDIIGFIENHWDRLQGGAKLTAYIHVNQKNKIMIITIQFEIDDQTPVLNNETTTIEESLHEALCLAIHEEDKKAMDWLVENIIDIQ